MRMIANIAELRAALDSYRAAGKTLGLVPTMGYLHEGHISLVRRSVSENDATVVSIFVNPTQFRPEEDLDSYPRDLDRDLGLLSEVGADVVFCPCPDSMYATDYSTYVDEYKLAAGLCGASRPGHFRGVCTVVLKLFNLTGPQRAYFGEKDYQQLQVIRRMVRDLDVPVDIVSCPIVREADGVAMSSRNVYLSPGERVSAQRLSQGLRMAQEAVAQGERSCSALTGMVRHYLEADPGVVIDYVEIKDPNTLDDVVSLDGEVRMLLAARVGKTRLIDNALLIPKEVL